MSGVPVVSHVVNAVTSVFERVVDIVVDVVTLDLEGFVMGTVDMVVDSVEGVVHTITHPTEDPIATIMLAAAVYGMYNTATASTATASTAKAAAAKAAAQAKAAGYSSSAQAAAATAASNAVYAQAGMSASASTAYAVDTSAAGYTRAAAAAGNVPITAVAQTATYAYAAPLSGSLYQGAALGQTVGTAAAQSSFALANAGIAVYGSEYRPGTALTEAERWADIAAGAEPGSQLAATAQANAASAVNIQNIMKAGGVSPNLYVSSGIYSGVAGFGIIGGLDAAAGMEGVGEVLPPGEGYQTGFIEGIEEAWRSGAQVTEEITRNPWRFIEEELIEPSENFLTAKWDELQDAWSGFTEDPLNFVGQQIDEHKWVKAGEDPWSEGGFLRTILGDATMADGGLADWSPTIGYQSGGDPGRGTAESFPSFARAETGILGDPFNLEGRDLALTSSRLANLLQTQQGPPFPTPQMQLPASVQAFRDRTIPMEQMAQLMDPDYGVSKFQQPMVNELISQLNANAQVRGLEPSGAGVARGIAPLLEGFRQQELDAFAKAAPLDVEAMGQGVGQRAGDIQAQLGYQDIGTAADVARKNVALNSLLALAQMTKPTIVGGTTGYSEEVGGVRPDVAFSGQVPVGGILGTGWDIAGDVWDWMTGDY